MKPHFFDPRTGKPVTGLGQAAKLAAAHNVQEKSLETLLRRWWVKKYQRPWTHELAQEATTSELLTEWWEDYLDEHPEKIYEILSNGGVFTFGETGDPLIDKWEREIAQGLDPDLSEGLPKAAKDENKKTKSLMRKLETDEFSFGEFSDDYATMGNGTSEKFDVKDLLGRG
jgi:hypothetical protein